MFVRFAPATNRFVVHQTPNLRPSKNKKNQNQIEYEQLHLFDFYFLLLFGCKNYVRNQ